MVVLTKDNVHLVLSDIVKKSKDCNEAITRICKLKYPKDSKSKEEHYIKKEEAKFFYQKYKKINVEISLDKNFTKKAYNMNSKIYKEIHVC